MDEVRQRCLSRAQDLPLWVVTRAWLLGEGAKLLENSARNGFVVWSAADGLGSVAGEPEPDALLVAARDVSELVAFADNIERMRSLLPGFVAELATVFFRARAVATRPILPVSGDLPKRDCRAASPIRRYAG